MHDWVRGRFRTRYQEIATKATDELRERIARDTVDLAIDLAAGEKEALRQTLAGLSDLNAVEASMVLRNLSTSKGINLDQEAKLRGRAGRGCPEARRTLNGGPPASSARVASVTGANQVREDSRNRHAEAIRVGGRHDRGGDRESAPCADPGGARRARRGSS
jgi:hypothetical protein